jgi:hypothetical protein
MPAATRSRSGGRRARRTRAASRDPVNVSSTTSIARSSSAGVGGSWRSTALARPRGPTGSVDALGAVEFEQGELRLQVHADGRPVHGGGAARCSATRLTTHASMPCPRAWNRVQRRLAPECAPLRHGVGRRAPAASRGPARRAAGAARRAAAARSGRRARSRGRRSARATVWIRAP